jgi:hypothetical protein
VRIARDTLGLSAPAGLVLLLAALAERAGAQTAVFYLFLAGIPVSGAAALASLARLVDAADAGVIRGGRFRAGLGASLVAVFVLGAAARSPVALELGATGAASAALALGFFLLGLHAVTALVPAARR